MIVCLIIIFFVLILTVKVKIKPLVVNEAVSQFPYTPGWYSSFRARQAGETRASKEVWRRTPYSYQGKHQITKKHIIHISHETN